MSIGLSSSVSAMAPGLSTSFLASGGTPPYVYSVVPGGAGGSINSSTGLYQAPLTMNPDPALTSDVIRALDSLSAAAQLPVLITNPLGLLCDILQKELGLDANHIYLWDQKIPQPNDSTMYIAVSVLNCKPFANTLEYDGSGGGMNAIQSVNMLATLSIDVISRGPEALDRKEEVLMALASNYSQSQQELNSFYIGNLPPGGQFVNLSNIDGSAIPYRFNISINMQYFVRKVKAVNYYGAFSDVEVTTEP